MPTPFKCEFRDLKAMAYCMGGFGCHNATAKRMGAPYLPKGTPVLAISTGARQGPSGELTLYFCKDHMGEALAEMERVITEARDAGLYGAAS